MLKRVMITSAFLLLVGCGQQGRDQNSAPVPLDQSPAPATQQAAAQHRNAPFNIATHDGVEVIRSGPVELTYLDITSATDNLYVEKVEVNEGKCIVMAQSFFFTPVTLNRSDKAGLRVVQPDSFGNLGLCDIQEITVGTNQGWYTVVSEGSHYSITEIDVPLENRDLPVPEDAVFVTDSAGREHCVEWDCLVSPSIGKVDATSVNLLKNGWIYGSPKFYEKSDDFSDNTVRTAIFQEDGKASCIVLRQSKDERSWEVTTSRYVYQGTYEVQPGGIRISGKELVNGCFKTGTTDSVVTVTVSLSPEERQLYTSPDGQSQYYSGKVHNWCRSRMRLTEHSARGTTLCEISGFSDAPLMKLMEAAASANN